MIGRGKPVRRVAIVGPYLVHNFGDDLIGAVLARSLQERYGIQVLLPNIRDKNSHWLRLPTTASTLDAVTRSQSVLIGGGGILGDSGVSPSNRYLLSGFMAAVFSRITGRPVAVTGVGAGPLAWRSSRILCRLLCALVPRVGVRDQQSARFLINELGIRSEKIVIGADVALLWPKTFDIQREELNAIGVQFDVGAYLSARKNPLLEDVTRSIVNFCGKWLEDIVLVSNGPAPTRLSHDFDLAPQSLHYTLLPSFLARLAGLRAIITSHLHLAIAAYAARIPCFSIYVRDKTRRFYEQIGHPERALDIVNATPEEVESLLGEVLDARWSSTDERRLEALQKDAFRLIKIVGGLFE